MIHFAAVNVQNLYINREEFESTAELADYPGVAKMFFDLFGDPTTFMLVVTESPFATPAECRLVADFFSAFLGTVDEMPRNVLLTNLNSDTFYVVHFN